MRRPHPSRGIGAQLCVVALFAAATLGQALTIAQAPSTVRILEVSIEAGNAAVTLSELVRQTGIQVLFETDVVRGHTTRAVSGRLDAAQALARMLEGSGLIFELINERTVAVRAGPLTRPTRL